METEATLYALVKVLGHEADCASLIDPDGEDGWKYDNCTPNSPECGVWEAARNLASVESLNRLLAMTWERGYRACQLRMGNELLRLLPAVKDAPNPYAAPSPASEVGA